jgi:hypothetical protein
MDDNNVNNSNRIAGDTSGMKVSWQVTGIYGLMLIELG